MVRKLPFEIDADDPRAPTEEQWASLSEEQRAQTVSMLPCDVPLALFMLEGDMHRLAKQGAIGALDAFFKKIGRKVYLSSEINVYYPGEPRFAPDVLAVLDAEPHPREKWIVSREGKGLDLVIEVHVSGEWKKDFEANRRRYARLGIPEYFLFDRTRDRLYGWRLPGASARTYDVIVPQLGRFPSFVLGLELGMEGDHLRFYSGTAPLPDVEELVGKLEAMVGGLVERREQEREARERAEQQRQQEREARERAEQQREQEREARERAEQQREQEREARERAEQQRDAALGRLAELEAELAKQRGR